MYMYSVINAKVGVGIYHSRVYCRDDYLIHTLVIVATWVEFSLAFVTVHSSML